MPWPIIAAVRARSVSASGTSGSSARIEPSRPSGSPAGAEVLAADRAALLGRVRARVLGPGRRRALVGVVEARAVARAREQRCGPARTRGRRRCGSGTAGRSPRRARSRPAWSTSTREIRPRITQPRAPVGSPQASLKLLFAVEAVGDVDVGLGGVVRVDRQPDQAAVPEVVRLPAHVDDLLGRRVPDPVEALDGAALLGDEDVAVGREAHRDRLHEPAERGRVGEAGRHGGARRRGRTHDDRDRPCQGGPPGHPSAHAHPTGDRASYFRLVRAPCAARVPIVGGHADEVPPLPAPDGADDRRAARPLRRARRTSRGGQADQRSEDQEGHGRLEAARGRRREGARPRARRRRAAHDDAGRLDRPAPARRQRGDHRRARAEQRADRQRRRRHADRRGPRDQLGRAGGDRRQRRRAGADPAATASPRRRSRTTRSTAARSSTAGCRCATWRARSGRFTWPVGRLEPRTTARRSGCPIDGIDLAGELRAHLAGHGVAAEPRLHRQRHELVERVQGPGVQPPHAARRADADGGPRRPTRSTTPSSAPRASTGTSRRRPTRPRR